MSFHRHIDIGSEIWRIGGALRGGQINILAEPPRRWHTKSGQRFLLFRLDDNDVADDGTKYFSALGVITKQRSAELRDVSRFGGMLRIHVDHIRAEKDECFDDPVDENRSLRLVVGRISPLINGNPTGTIDMPTSGDGVAYIEKFQTLSIGSFTAEHQLIYAHFICLNENAARVSYDEKQRRVTALLASLDAMAMPEDSRNATNVVDGNQRLMAILR